MQCPVCKEVNLSMTDRQGIEIDYCPQCRGIWLDRGELDRLIERAERATPEPSNTAAGSREDRYRQRRGDFDHEGRYPRRRKSLLGELFDF
ncbi:MAG: zf-TFIIB domain-containing protein [Pseudomonadota bacterium]